MKLQFLYLRKTEVTAAGIAELKTAVLSVGQRLLWKPARCFHQSAKRLAGAAAAGEDGGC